MYFYYQKSSSKNRIKTQLTFAFVDTIFFLRSGLKEFVLEEVDGAVCWLIDYIPVSVISYLFIPLHFVSLFLPLGLRNH